MSEQILDVDSEEQEGATHNEQNAKKSKCAVIKTSTRQTVFLPIIGLVPHNQLAPGDLIGVNKDSYLVLDKLPDGGSISCHLGAKLIGSRVRREGKGDGSG